MGWGVGEVYSLYEPARAANLNLDEFSEWLRRNPKYEVLADFWAELSDSLEVDVSEFKSAMKHVLGSYVTVIGGSPHGITLVLCY